jgi:hypothetical protein
MIFRKKHQTASFSLLITTLICVLMLSPSFGFHLHTSAVRAQENPEQRDIDGILGHIQETYGVGFAFPGEWQARYEDELPLIHSYAATINASLEQVAHTLWMLDGSPPYLSPSEHFRLHFDQANIQIDRVGHLGGYGGNTMPVYEDGLVIAYLIQLAPVGLGRTYTLAHEIGHVLDNLLADQPQWQHREMLGGAWTPTYWVPGSGYEGNEARFPRALAGPNEDFADTFGQMMVGGLNPFDETSSRWLYMTTHTRHWLALLRSRRITQLISIP